MSAAQSPSEAFTSESVYNWPVSILLQRPLGVLNMADDQTGPPL